MTTISEIRYKIYGLTQGDGSHFRVSTALYTF